MKPVEIKKTNDIITPVENNYKYIVNDEEEGTIGIPLNRLKYLCGDGNFSSRGWDLYIIENHPKFLFINWSKWQGETTEYSLINRKNCIEIIDRLSLNHPDRYQTSLNKIGEKIPEISSN